MTSLQAALDSIAASVRQSRREFGESMPTEAILNWLTSDSFARPIQLEARCVIAEPNNSGASWFLMRAIMGQLRRRFRGEVRSARLANTTAHRNAFRAVARINREQKR